MKTMLVFAFNIVLLCVSGPATAQAPICKLLIGGEGVNVPVITGHLSLKVKVLMPDATLISSAEVDAPGFTAAIGTSLNDASDPCKSFVFINLTINPTRPNGIREISLFKTNAAGGRNKVAAFRINAQAIPKINTMVITTPEGVAVTDVIGGDSYQLTIQGEQLTNIDLKVAAPIFSIGNATAPNNFTRSWQVVFNPVTQADVLPGLPAVAFPVFGDGSGQSSAIAIRPAGRKILPRPFFLPQNEDWSGGPYFGSKGNFFADVNGDHKADAIVVTNTNVVVRPSNGSEFKANEYWTANAYFGDKGTFFADVTGDGRADAIAVNAAQKVVVRRSVGDAFSANEEWTNIPYFGEKGTFFADVTGDGIADAIVVNNNRIVVRRSTGNGFNLNEEWTTGPYFGKYGTYFADVNGDDLADAIVSNDDGITVRRSSGSGFLASEKWINTLYAGTKGTFFVDVTGDDKADAIMVANNSITIRKSTGSTFAAATIGTNDAFFGDFGTFFADLTGTGKAFAIAVKNAATVVRRPYPTF